MNCLVLELCCKFSFPLSAAADIMNSLTSYLFVLRVLQRGHNDSSTSLFVLWGNPADTMALEHFLCNISQTEWLNGSFVMFVCGGEMVGKCFFSFFHRQQLLPRINMVYFRTLTILLFGVKHTGFEQEMFFFFVHYGPNQQRTDLFLRSSA